MGTFKCLVKWFLVIPICLLISAGFVNHDENRLSSASLQSLEPLLEDYHKAIDVCDLKISPKPDRVWESVSGTLHGVSFYIIRPDILLLEGNVITIPIVFKSESSQRGNLDVNVRSVPFELISTTHNQTAQYEIPKLAANSSEIRCHEFKATWDGRWSIIVDIEPGEEIPNDTATLDIQIADNVVWAQFSELRNATQQAAADARAALIAAAVGTAAIAIIMLVDYLRPRKK